MSITETAETDDASTIARHGITTSTVTFYHYGAYRYSSLKAAVAEAERDKNAS